MNGCGDHSSGADDDLEVVEPRKDGLLVQACQDVHPGYFLPAALWWRRMWDRRRPHDVAGEQIVLELVTLVWAIFLLQKGQQLQPAGGRII